MMRIVRVVVAWLLVVSVSSPVVGGELIGQPRNESAVGLREAVAKVAEQAVQSEPAGPMPRGYLWAGSALFVGGMAAGLYGFLNNKNGKFPEFGEAESTNTKLGTAGLATAFVGGTILFLGSRRSNRAPSVTLGPGRISASKTISW